jgi:alginate O-acetyltransferase complex protein AlgI
MLFPTIDFAVFFVVVFTFSWILRPHRMAWRWFILAASCFFYAYWDWRFVFLLLGSIVMNWLFGETAYRSLGPEGTRTARSKWIVRASVVANLAVLGYFKYLDFFVTSVAERLDALGLGVDPPVLNIILPAGISFFTFQAMSYVLDIGRGEWRRPMTLIDFAVFLSFFPQVVAGPIVRADEFAPQLDPPPDPRYVRYSEAFMLIFRGLFKKVVISSFLAAQIVDPVFAVPEAYGRWEVLWAIYAYAIQIYADFSGYTDIAIGVALLLGFRFPQNFDAPYVSRSVQEFWRRWHMTLSRWLRDYLYIPLGGNRGTKAFTYRNLFLVMMIGGLWHGANWTFVVWGCIHGGALVVERVVKERWAARGPIGLPPPVVSALQWFLTFNVVCLAWVFFRSPSVGDAMTMLGRLFAGGGAPSVVSTLVLVTVIASLASQFVPPRVAVQGEKVFERLAPLAQVGILALGLVAIDALGPEGVAPFIYFQF